MLFAVDNCFCTPALQKPFELGADLVIHSATKYLDGQGRCVGGAVVGNEQLVGKDIFGFLRSAGPSMSPFNAWVFLKGLETLELRMRAHSAAALELARWLEGQPGVRKVSLRRTGIASAARAGEAPAERASAASSRSKSSTAAKGAWAFIDATRLMSITANLGDTKTTITHPGDARRIRASRAAERERAGITEGLLRISVGLWRTCDDLQGRPGAWVCAAVDRSA